MAIKITLTGDTADLKSQLRSLGVEFEELDDATLALGKSAEGTGKKMQGAFDAEMESRIAGIEDATRRAAEATETLAMHAGGMNETAEALGNVERVALGVNDVLGVAAEQFGVNIGPAQEYAQAMGDVAGGLEGVIGGGMALAEQLGPMAAKLVPAITGAYAHATALYAQAAAFVAANLPMIALIAGLALLGVWIVQIIRHWDEITAKVPALAVATEVVKDALDSFVGWIRGPFIDGLQTFLDKFDAVFKAVELLVTSQVKAWAIVFETGFKVIMGLVDVFAGLVTGDFGRLKDGVTQIFGSLWEGAEKMFKLGIDTITGLAPLMLDAGKAIGGAMKDGFVGALNGALGLTGDIANALIGLFESAINFVVGKINDAIPDKISVPHLPDIELPDNPVGEVRIPRLAKGGIVDEPTLALIGEAGPEAVVPLSSANAKGGSLLGIGNPGPVSGAKTAANPSVNLSLAELKDIKAAVEDSRELDRKMLAVLETIAARLISGSRTAGDAIAGTEEGLEALPAIYQVLAEIRDGGRLTFGNGTV